jgi:hypothetical protein
VSVASSAPHEIVVENRSSISAATSPIVHNSAPSLRVITLASFRSGITLTYRRAARLTVMPGDARDISQVIPVQINETVSTGFELWDEIVVFCSTIFM